MLDIFGEVERLKKEVWYLKTKTIPALQDMIEAGGGQNLTEIETALSQLQTTVSGLSNTVESIDTTLGENTSDISSLTQQLSSVSTQLSQAEADISAIQTSKIVHLIL